MFNSLALLVSLYGRSPCNLLLDSHQGTEPAEVEAQGQIFDGVWGDAFCQVHIHLLGGAEGEASSQVCKPPLPFQWDLVLVLLTAALGTFLGIQEGNRGGSHFPHSTPHLRPLPGRASASMSAFLPDVKTQTEGVAF